MCNLIALIPTTPSALYNTFGLDFAVPATPGEEPTMTTTTQTGTVDYRVAADYYGDFAHEYDTEAIDAEVLAQLNILTPEGVSVAANGMVFATIEAADEAREIDWRELLDQIDVDAIMIKHEIRAMV